MLESRLMKEDIQQIKQDYLKQIQQASDLKTLDELYLKLFGKSGEITLLPKHFSSLNKQDLMRVGPLFNKVKSELESAIDRKRGAVREDMYKNLNQERFDTNTKTELKNRVGHMHPTTQFVGEIVDIFSKTGFQQYDSPHIDTDYYNFEVLNIPQQHPARDLWDTLYVDSKTLGDNQKLLLRTHTSNAQIRILREFKPPIRMMVLGPCFRYENLDARHEHTFEQFELVYVDKGVSMANLQYLSEYFLKSVLKKNIKVRLRPKYYPFVEPGVGIDGECMFCDGKGCKVCGGIGWLELGGAGMIHPTVLKNGGLDPEVYSGIAWGPGLGRILMLKHGIDDLRLFRSGDLKFLSSF